ncbi:MAG: MutS protein msh5 [Pycnora praestabilis]|nr:MAG: MutS protein msh5 [Pycnora praestabilis]
MAFKVPTKRARESSVASSRLSWSRQTSALRTSHRNPSQQSRATPQIRVSLPPSSRQSSAAPSLAGDAPENDREIEDREENDNLNEIIMGIDMRDRGTVGCCYYVAREEKLYLMEDVAFGGLEVINMLKVHVEPTVILLSSRVDESVDAHLDPQGRRRGSVAGDNDQFGLPYILELRPSREFNYESAKNKLINLRIGSDSGPQITFATPGDGMAGDAFGDRDDSGFIGRQGSFLRLSAWIDMGSRLSASLLPPRQPSLEESLTFNYWVRLDVLVQLSLIFNGEEVRASFQEMNMQALESPPSKYTLSSLQVLQLESHPNSHNQGPTSGASGSKEGLSVYGLFQHLAHTPQGKQLLRQYFLRPSVNIGTITERWDTISVFLRPDNNEALNTLVKSLKQVKNIRTVMIHLHKGISCGTGKGGGIARGVWASMNKFVYHALKIRDTFCEVANAMRLDITVKILNNFEPFPLAQVGRMISETIDFPVSTEQHRTTVKPGVNEHLDNMKRTYDGIESLLSEIARQLAETMPEQVQATLNVIFFPQIGFLIAVPIEGETGRGIYEGGVDEEEPWERMFATDSVVYFKNTNMRELDEHFGDMYGLICDKEIEIIHELAQNLLGYEGVLVMASDICGELDSLLALAEGAKKYNFTRPLITEENVIHIKEGRHPLQELTVPNYVPNDTYLVGGRGNESTVSNDEPEYVNSDGSSRMSAIRETQEGPSMLMMTGPNYSGKSVYLKQVALIVYMAHIVISKGSFVPAESAKIGLTDKILTRIATRETVSKVIDSSASINHPLTVPLQIQSAFMIDLQQVALAINLATRRSLIIIDEFGKGTDSNGTILLPSERYHD